MRCSFSPTSLELVLALAAVPSGDARVPFRVGDGCEASTGRACARRHGGVRPRLGPVPRRIQNRWERDVLESSRRRSLSVSRAASVG